METNDSICSVQGLYDYTSTDPASLSFNQGDIIHVLAKLESGWWDGWCNGRRGWFPSNYVEEIIHEPHNATTDLTTPVNTDQIMEKPPYQQEEGIVLTNNIKETDMVHRSHREDTLLHQQITSAQSNWILQTTEDGSEVYYYNVVTKEMRYSLPPGAHFETTLPPSHSVTSPHLNASNSLNSSAAVNTSTNGRYHDDVHPSSPTATNTSPTLHPTMPITPQSMKPITTAAAPNDTPLPPHWVRKVDTRGRVYYCNLLTDETTWHVDQIDQQTGNLNVSQSQRTRDTTSNSSATSQENQPLSWNQLSSLIAHAIHSLKNSIRQGQSALLREDVVMVVHRVRLMLYVSNTVDKESSPYLKSNKSLRFYHRALLASLAKTVLSTKAASGTWSQEDALHKLQMDADQLLVDVRNFLSAAQELRLEVHDDRPRLLSPDNNNHSSLSSDSSLSISQNNPPSSLTARGHRWRLTSSSMDNGSKPDPSTTLLVLADNIRGAMSSFMESIRNAFSSLNDQASAPSKVKTTAPLLVAQFRNLSNTASQFLNAVDDLPPQHQHLLQDRPTTTRSIGSIKGYPPRQVIHNAMGLLFIASQTITNSDLTIAMIKLTYRRLEQCIHEIEKNVQTICLDVTKAAGTLNGNNSSSPSSSSLASVSPPPPTSHQHQSQQQQQQQASSRPTSVLPGLGSTPPTPSSRPDTLLEDQDVARDILDEIYADEDIMGDARGFGSVHPTALPANGAPGPPPSPHRHRHQLHDHHQHQHSFHSPPSSAKYPPSSSSSSYYHPHQTGSNYSPSLFPHEGDMEVDSYHSNNQPYPVYNSNNGELSPAMSTPSSATTPRPPKDKLAKFFGEDTLLAAKRRDTILGSNSPTIPANNMASSSATVTTTATSNTNLTNASVSSASGVITSQTTAPPTSIAATTTATTPTSLTASSGFGNGSSLLMGNDKPDYLCADYKQNEIIFNMEGNVKGGTVLALVQRLTQHDQLDSKFITTFLLTYRSFCTTEELFDCLFSRYTLQPPGEMTEEELEIWNEKKLKLVRLRVFNVIKSWLDSYYIEEEDRVILPTLLNFTETVIRESMQFGAEQLGKVIQKRMAAEDSSQLRKMTLNVRTSEIPPPILPKNMKRLRFLEIDPLELARQLTVMDSKLYSRIKPVECLDKNWGRADSQHTAANVKASIEYSNQVTAWVTDSILSKEELKKRSAVVKHWIYVAEKCRLLHNYNTCMAILSAFDNSSIGRLKRTWETMSARTTAILTGIRRLMGANRNFTEYRDIIHKVNPPCIPFLGIYLQDLTFIEDGNSNFLKKTNNLINFAKRMKTGEVIRELQQYQSTPYILQSVPDIQEFIKTHLQSSRDEETLYNLSLAVEPRERGEDTIARRLKESGL